MFINKNELKELIQTFLFEKKQKVDKKYLPNITSQSAIKHNKTGYEYTVVDNVKTPETGKPYLSAYRHDLDNPDKKIYEKITYDQFEKEYSMV